MHNPFKTSASADPKPASASLTIKILLWVLAAVTAYMLAKDISYLLITEKGTLKRAGSVSLAHHLYLVVLPFEIAYFRLASSVAALAFILFSLRNNHALARNSLFLYAYGTTQLIYQILAVTGIIGILNQISATSVLQASYWLSPSMLSNTALLLLRFVLVLLPPVAFLVLCTITTARIKSRIATT